MNGSLVVGAPHWFVPAVALGAVATLAVLISYWFVPARGWLRATGGALKLVAIATLFLCLLEPLWSAKKPREGANLFVLLTDNSESLQMHNQGAATSRAEDARQLLAATAPWQVRLRQDFDVRWYAFDQRLRAIDDVTQLTFDGAGTAFHTSLQVLADRYRDRPVSGVLLFSDGITNDTLDDLLSRSDLPPIYPVLLSDAKPVTDVRIAKVSVNQSNFELAPVSLAVELQCVGRDRASLVVQLCSESGAVLESQTVETSGVRPPTARFEFRPEATGVLFYQVRVCLLDEEGAFEHGRSSEATLANNYQLVTVDRAKGPYRVLYVAGRPNWEFKFLRRAIEEDQEVQLVGLLRIARREAKFDFRGHLNENTNPLYRGFGNEQDEQAEQYDEPVLLRLGTKDAAELRSGFPRVPEELFAYDAVILDDLESGFFTQDQLSLLQQFVSQRGGGFLMLGGQESFDAGAYRHTPVAEMLPVYLDRPATPAQEDRYRLVYTREGILQPWTRLRATEEAERQRVDAMPPLHIVNLVDAIKPGATVLTFARASSGEEYPALIAQPFGRGRTLALAVGDLWRWGLHRRADQPRELPQAWRQCLRWLVADVPRRVEVEVLPVPDDPLASLDLSITAQTATYEPLDNASVNVTVTGPDGTTMTLVAEPGDTEAGLYQARFVPAQSGAYRAHVTVTAADGSEVGTRETGWTADPTQTEYASLQPRRELMQQLASQTGGELLAPADLASFVADLPNRRNVITQPWTFPFWHQWWVFALTVFCLIGEWGLRRWKGLP